MLKHFSKLLIFSLCTCAATTAQAAVVSSDSAKQLAADFFAASDNERLASADALELSTHQEPLPNRSTMSLMPAIQKAT